MANDILSLFPVCLSLGPGYITYLLGSPVHSTLLFFSPPHWSKLGHCFITHLSALLDPVSRWNRRERLLELRESSSCFSSLKITLLCSSKQSPPPPISVTGRFSPGPVTPTLFPSLLVSPLLVNPVLFPWVGLPLSSIECSWLFQPCDKLV